MVQYKTKKEKRDTTERPDSIEQFFCERSTSWRGGVGCTFGFASMHKPTKNFLSVLSTAAILTFSSSVRLSAQQLNFRHYGPREGLQQSQIISIYQDNRGFLWFGSYSGISRFDGHRIETLDTSDGLADNSVSDIAGDIAGNLYFATLGGGLSVFDGNSYQHFSAGQGLLNNSVNDIHIEDNGRLWVATDGGLTSIFRDRSTHYTKRDGINAKYCTHVYRSTDGHLWLGTEIGLYLLQNEKFIYQDFGNHIVDPQVNIILEDAQKSLWIGTSSGLLRKDDARFEVIDLIDTLPPVAITSGARDRDDSLWFGSDQGVFRHFRGELTHYDSRSGLHENFVNAVLIDREQNIWFGTENGVARFRDGPFVHYNKQNGLADDDALDIIEDGEQKIWIGTSKGISIFDNGELYPLDTSNTFASGIINALAKDGDGNIFIGSEEGLGLWDGSKISILEDDYGIVSLMSDDEGRVWIGTTNGVSWWESGRLHEFSDDSPLSNNWINCITTDRNGRIWFGTADSGCLVLDGGDYFIFDNTNGLTNQEIWSIGSDRKGGVWNGTNGDGAFHYDGEKFTKYTTAQGLDNNFVWQALADSRGNIWLGTNTGLNRFDGQGFQQFDTNDGLAANEGMADSIFEDSHGRIWIGSGSGVSVLESTLSLEPPADIPIYIERIVVADETLEAPEGLVLESDENTVQFEYVGLNYRNETSVRYRFRVEGLDNDWSEITSERSVRYAKIPPGDFSFVVQATNNHGLTWSTTPANVDFKINPPFYMTWWFTTSMASFAALSVILMHTARVKKIHREKISLERQVHYRTNDLARANEQLHEQINERDKARGDLAARLRLEKGLAAFSRTLVLEREDPLTEALRHLVQVSDTSRVFICENIEDSSAGLCMRTIAAAGPDGGSSLIGRLKVRNYPYDTAFSRWKRALSEGNPISGNVEDLPECERVVLESLAIISILLIPIMVRGRWYGYIGFDDIQKKREWKDEPTLLGTAAQLIGTFIEREQATEALRQSEERFASTFHEAPVGIVLSTIDGRIVQSNPAFQKLLGCQEMELLDLTYDELTHPEDRGNEDSYLQRCCRGEITSYQLEKRFIKRNGESVFVNLTAAILHDKSGEPAYAYGIAEDITQRRQAEEALRESKKRYQMLVEKLEEGILLEDKEGIITFVNPRAAEMLATSEEELTGKHWSCTVAREGMDKIKTESENRSKGQSSKYESCLESKDGRAIPVLISATPIFNESDEYQGTLSVFADITERKQIEVNLREAKIAAEQASQMKTRFLSNVSHEIRTPLNAIIGFSESIRQADEPELVNKFTEAILQESEVLLELINDLLNNAKIEAGKLELEHEPFDLHSLVGAIANSFSVVAEAKGLDFSWTIDEDVPRYVVGDSLRLRQAIGNLVSNACKFTKKGSVTLNARLLAREDKNARIGLWVIDTGIGIPKAKQETIFQSFTQADGSTTREFGGTGLGTTIARQLVNLMGGELGLKSEPGEGSTFWLSVPLDLAQVPIEQGVAHAKEADIESGKSYNGHILVVEDYPPNQEVARLHLASAGFTVEIAENGKLAVEACRRGVFDLIFMDIQMPEMDGYEATRQIQSESLCRSVPILAMTADADRATEDSAHAAGMCAMITKPIRRQQIIATAAEWIEGEQVQPNSENRKSEPATTEEAELPWNIDAVQEELGGIEIARDLVDELLKNIEKQTDVMHRALSDGDMETLGRESHSIKGGAGTLMAIPLSKAAGRLEELCKARDTEPVPAVLEELVMECHRLKAYVGRCTGDRSLVKDTSRPV